MRHRSLSQAFGRVLRKYRKAKGISQEHLAELADISSKMVSLIERAERNPSIDLADSLAEGLGISLSDLIAEAKHSLQNGHQGAAKMRAKPRQS